MRTTLNLLPPGNKAALRSGFVFAYMQSMLIVVLLVGAIGMGTLVAVRMLVKNVHADFASRSTSSSQEHVALLEEIRGINAYLKRIEKLQAAAVPWSSVLREATDLAPDGVRLTSIAVESSGKMTLAGFSTTRDGVLVMRDRLEASPSFEKVQSPLSNILQQRDVHFEFEMQHVRPAAPAVSVP